MVGFGVAEATGVLLRRRAGHHEPPEVGVPTMRGRIMQEEEERELEEVEDLLEYYRQRAAMTQVGGLLRGPRLSIRVCIAVWVQ